MKERKEGREEGRQNMMDERKKKGKKVIQSVSEEGRKRERENGTE